jgi:hypothetical protein
MSQCYRQTLLLGCSTWAAAAPAGVLQDSTCSRQSALSQIATLDSVVMREW